VIGARTWPAAAALAALTLLAACGSSKPKPTPLEPLEAKIAGRQVWRQEIGKIDFPLQMLVRGDRFIVADTSGSVVALSIADGREAWRVSVGERITAGVGSDGRTSAVVTRDNELVVISEGGVRWRKRLSSPVVTAPLVAGDRVFVVGVDRAVHAFDAQDGGRLWSLQRPGDALTLASTGVLSAYRDTLLVGQGTRLLSVDPLKGAVRWEVTVASPRGTNEVERLADLVGPAQRDGDTFCVRAFQAAIGCVDAGRAALAWSQNAGGVEAIGGDAQFVYSADASDRITARRRASGETAWSNERLLYRGLSTPAGTGKTVVFGDSEGLLHFFASDSGTPLLRLPTDGSPIVGAPVVAGTTMLVATRKGSLYAFRPE
jgi:outer membrane protein assembly factor BamB